jgi:hypothetical protein
MPTRQFTARPEHPRAHPGRPRRPLVIWLGFAVPLAILSGAGAVLAASDNQPAAAEPNPNCTLVVPPDPLSARGLATPYQLLATDRRKGGCHESNPDQAAFVEATVLDPGTGAVSVYHPLVTDQGSRPAVAPARPALPGGAVVGIWFGYNGDTLTLRGEDRGTLGAARCVNGLGGSLFGQFAHCNAVAFFKAANAAIAARKLVVPATGRGRDGLPCPTVRDFGVVDQDMSDNVVSSYLIVDGSRTAPNNAANRASLAGRAAVLTNGSDNGLVDRFVDPALGCAPWTAPDLGDPGTKVPSLALNELSAAAARNTPVALVPTNDPMTQVNGRVSVDKTNLYRAGVDQPLLDAGANTGRQYCEHLVTQAPPRLIRDRQLLQAAPSPDPAAAKNLFGFLAQRLRSSYDLLGCGALLHRRNPIRLQVNAAGTVVDAAPLAASADPATPATPDPSVSAQHF